MSKTLRIRAWMERFENNRTKELRTMAWRPEHVDLGSGLYVEIVDHPDGAAHYGALTVIRNIAARGNPRGYLVMDDGRPHDAKSLARVSRMPENLIEAAIKRLLDIGELEYLTKKSRVTNRLRSQEGAAISQEGAAIPPLQEGNKKEQQEGQELNRKTPTEIGKNNTANRILSTVPDSAASGVEPALPSHKSKKKCCEDTGLRSRKDDVRLIEFCSCECGEQRRLKDPGACDTYNTEALRFAKRFAS